MKIQRKKRSESFWPSIVMKKWLNVPPNNKDFSEDEIDTETETESEDDDQRMACPTQRNMSACSSGTSDHAAKVMVKHKRGKSETMRVHYIKTKDVRCGSKTAIIFLFLVIHIFIFRHSRVTIGSWNVAGKLPNEDLDIDQWLCMHETTDIYVLGFQEVVPLNAGNVLGAETRMPVSKWEAIIRKSLNKSLESETVPKSYSAPTSPVKDNIKNEDLSDPQTNGFYGLDWPEYALDIKQDVCFSGARNLRRVLSSSDRVANDWFSNPGPNGWGLRKARHSLGDLGSLNSTNIQLDSLYDVSERLPEEDDNACIQVEEKSPSLQTTRKSDKYVRIMSKQMVGIYVSIWVRKRLRRHINNMNISPVGVGLMGYIGNKGSISVSMSLYQTRLCFVCCHLTSGHKGGDDERRNSDVVDILKRTYFSSVLDPDQPPTILTHDRVFWFGDLNYRIDMTDTEVRKLITMKHWDKLLYYDQLCKELKSGHVFEGWKEGVINFPPTYKYEINSDQYVGEVPKEGNKRRTPAWCDRILWLGKGIKQVCYNRMESRFSDHRPVSSVFLVEVEVFDPRKLRRALNLTNAVVHPEIILDDEQDLEL